VSEREQIHFVSGSGSKPARVLDQSRGAAVAARVRPARHYVGRVGLREIRDRGADIHARRGGGGAARVIRKRKRAAQEQCAALRTHNILLLRGPSIARGRDAVARHSRDRFPMPDRRTDISACSTPQNHRRPAVPRRPRCRRNIRLSHRSSRGCCRNSHRPILRQRRSRSPARSRHDDDDGNGRRHSSHHPRRYVHRRRARAGQSRGRGLPCWQRGHL
jgi:hypothetical protein